MEETEGHLTSAAAFVEGGVQDACDEACSICLEDFSDCNPSSMTNCKHGFHLQCILEWCQRSSQCPMCWQDVSLEDNTSQELLEAIQQERRFRATAERHATRYQLPTLGDFGMQHFPVSATASDAELEERIMQHLAAATAMRRAHHTGRREANRIRSSTNGHPRVLVFSSGQDTRHDVSSSSIDVSREHQSPVIEVASPPVLLSTLDNESLQQTPHSFAQSDQSSPFASGSNTILTDRRGFSFNSRNKSSLSSPSKKGAGPSEFQSSPESFRSKFNAVSMRYKESFSRSARGWKERFLSCNNSMSDNGSDVRREDNMGISRVSRMMESVEVKDNNTPSIASVSNAGRNNQNSLEALRESPPLDETNTTRSSHSRLRS